MIIADVSGLLLSAYTESVCQTFNTDVMIIPSDGRTRRVRWR